MASSSHHRFFSEALPVLSSYLFTNNVELGAQGGSISDLSGSEYDGFANYFRLRRAIVFARKLQPILIEVERNVSTASHLERKNVRGAISGRLDIPRYLRARAQSRSLTRNYPVIVNATNCFTPENELIRACIFFLHQELRGYLTLPRSAERRVASELFFWTGSKMRVPPWNELPRSFPNANLVRQVENRIYKKQTGNLVAYQAFLDWYAILNTNLDLNSSSSNVNFVQELLAFPVEEFFWDRVFEVWVLQEIYFSLLRNGCVTETETADLNTRGASPIYDLHFNGRAVSVYFQCGFNGDSARWSYESTGKNLRGIPDVLVDDGQDGLLVVDAKNRSGDNIRSKSEEIYKMLGYIENFRSLQEEKYFGILFFVSQNYQREQVLAENGGRLLLMTATLERIPSSFETDLDEMILGWLNR